MPEAALREVQVSMGDAAVMMPLQSIENDLMGDIAPSPSIPLPKEEGRKPFSPGEKGRDEGAPLNLIFKCFEFGNAR